MERAEPTPPVAKPLTRLVPETLLIATDPLAAAQDLESQGKWRQATNYYHTAYTMSKVPEIRLRGLMGQSQMALNLGRLEQAFLWVSAAEDSINIDNLSLARALVLKAKVLERMGGFMLARGLLDEAAVLGHSDEGLVETIKHYRGRAGLGQGLRSHEDSYVHHAAEIFKELVDEYTTMANLGDIRPANMGFQYIWLARALEASGDKDAANSNINNAEESFRLFLKDHPQTGIMADVHQLRGEMLVREGNFLGGREDLYEAFRLTTEVEDQPLAAAEAGYWIGRSFLSDYIDEMAAPGLSKDHDRIFNLQRKSVAWRSYALATDPYLSYRI